MQTKLKNLTTQTETLIMENDKLNSENKKLMDTLSDNRKALKNLQRQYDTLKTESADFLDLKKRFEKASHELTGQTRKAKELEKMVEELQLYQYIKWFLAGSGVLPVGFIIGFSTKKHRRQSSLY